MSLNDVSLLKYTISQVKAPDAEVDSNINIVTPKNPPKQELNGGVDEGYSVNSIGSTISDEALEKIYATGALVNNPLGLNSTQNVVTTTTTLGDFTEDEIANIKELIFKHQCPDKVESFLVDIDSKLTIKDTASLFDYLGEISDYKITRENGISKKQLYALTQNDGWEDAHNDFFGSINRVWQYLDLDENDTLSYQELKKYIGFDIGKLDEYNIEVEIHSANIQNAYKKMTEQEKLNYAIELASDYCETAGLTYQIDALNRLLGQESNLYYDGYVAQRGNIAISTYFKEGVLGGYSYYPYSWKHENAYYNKNNDEYYDMTLLYSDMDKDLSVENDCGITLNATLLDGQWYELVNTLVHELTHATAYRYSGDGKGKGYQDGTIPYTMIEDLYKINILSVEQKTYFQDNWNNLSDDDIKELVYYSTCAWGEYSAYQVDADYNDSIGRDVYNKYDYYSSATTVDGADEAAAIRFQIEYGYNGNRKDGENDELCKYDHKEARPDYNWWTYSGELNDEGFVNASKVEFEYNDEGYITQILGDGTDYFENGLNFLG
ncbi:MAG: SprT family zinc-dependent metalloprotease [Cyanobacteria bacterium SIG26]|nr:SprT family zinc-dependent metalloprotease [Cyanobacteria bacterium SIG26]